MRPSGETPMAASRSATSSYQSRYWSVSSSRKRWIALKLGPTTFQWACFVCRLRSMSSTRVAWSGSADLAVSPVGWVSSSCIMGRPFHGVISWTLSNITQNGRSSPSAHRAGPLPEWNTHSPYSAVAHARRWAAQVYSPTAIESPKQGDRLFPFSQWASDRDGYLTHPDSAAGRFPPHAQNAAREPYLLRSTDLLIRRPPLGSLSVGPTRSRARPSAIRQHPRSESA